MNRIFILFLFSILTLSSFAQFNVTQIETTANSEDYPTYLAISKNNSIYTYFTKSGIKIYKDKKWNILNDQVKELKTIPVSCFYIDQKDRLWIGTDSKGLYLLTNNQLKKYPDSIGKYISEIIEDRNETILIATIGNGFSKIDSKNNIEIHKAELTYQQMIVSIAIDSAGIVWLGTQNNGIMNYDHGIWNEFPTTNGNDAYVPIIEIDSKDRKWFLYWRNEGVKMFDNKNWIHYKDASEEGNYTTCYLRNSKNKNWIGTPYGIKIFKNNTLKKLNTNSTLDNQYIFSMIEDRNQQIWIATKKGLFILK